MAVNSYGDKPAWRSITNQLTAGVNSVHVTIIRHVHISTRICPISLHATLSTQTLPHAYKHIRHATFHRHSPPISDNWPFSYLAPP